MPKGFSKGWKEKDKNQTCFLSRSFFFFEISFLKSGPVQTGRPPPGRGGGWQSESPSAFNGTQIWEWGPPLGTQMHLRGNLLSVTLTTCARPCFGGAPFC